MESQNINAIVYQIKKYIYGDANYRAQIGDEVLREKVKKLIAEVIDDQASATDEDDQDFSINRCLGCGIDLGECNPRQYCCKTYCPELIHN